MLCHVIVVLCYVIVVLCYVMLCYVILLCYYNHPSQLIKQARAQALSASSADLVEEDQEVFFLSIVHHKRSFFYFQ